jgi:hypothetical protein
VDWMSSGKVCLNREFYGWAGFPVHVECLIVKDLLRKYGDLG